MSPGLIEMLRIMGMPRCVEAADVIESQAAELAHHKAWVAHQTKRIAELEAALAQPAAPPHKPLTDKQIIDIIHPIADVNIVFHYPDEIVQAGRALLAAQERIK